MRRQLQLPTLIAGSLVVVVTTVGLADARSRAGGDGTGTPLSRASLISSTRAVDTPRAGQRPPAVTTPTTAPPPPPTTAPPPPPPPPTTTARPPPARGHPPDDGPAAAAHHRPAAPAATSHDDHRPARAQTGARGVEGR